MYRVRLYDGPRPIGTGYAPRPIHRGDLLRMGDRWFVAAGYGAADVLPGPELGEVIELTPEEE
jgi:hypothetical protein